MRTWLGCSVAQASGSHEALQTWGESLMAICLLLHGRVAMVLSRDRLLLQGCWLHPSRAAGP